MKKDKATSEKPVLLTTLIDVIVLNYNSLAKQMPEEDFQSGGALVMIGFLSASVVALSHNGDSEAAEIFQKAAEIATVKPDEFFNMIGMLVEKYKGEGLLLTPES